MQCVHMAAPGPPLRSDRTRAHAISNPAPRICTPSLGDARSCGDVRPGPHSVPTGHPSPWLSAHCIGRTQRRGKVPRPHTTRPHHSDNVRYTFLTANLSCDPDAHTYQWSSTGRLEEGERRVQTSRKMDLRRCVVHVWCYRQLFCDRKFPLLASITTTTTINNNERPNCTKNVAIPPLQPIPQYSPPHHPFCDGHPRRLRCNPHPLPLTCVQTFEWHATSYRVVVQQSPPCPGTIRTSHCRRARLPHV